MKNYIVTPGQNTCKFSKIIISGVNDAELDAIEIARQLDGRYRQVSYQEAQIAAEDERSYVHGSIALGRNV